MVIDRGHELAAHSYTQDTLAVYLSPEEELANMRRCISIFEEKLGQRPQGWLCPVLASTDHTAEFVCQEGFLWHGDYNDIDVPMRVRTEKGTTIALPHTDFADNRVLRQSPEDFVQAYKSTFDYLYNNEPGATINVTVHCQFGGRPLISAAFREVLMYFRSFPDVWFARHDELARWFGSLDIDEVSYASRFYREAVR
jgi:peptidoglycan/xylan/chitin deacetylase (PgdA/CDA1 family)